MNNTGLSVSATLNMKGVYGLQPVQLMDNLSPVTGQPTQYYLCLAHAQSTRVKQKKSF